MTKTVIAKGFRYETWADGTRRSRPPQRFPVGEWVDLTPSVIDRSSSNTSLGGGFAVHPTDPFTMWWTNCGLTLDANAGLWKTTDGGLTWRKVGKCPPSFGGAVDYVQCICHVRVDPNDGNKLYMVSGVRGDNLGFWISTDGGENFTTPASFYSVAPTNDCYDVAMDPTDANHLLVSFHSAWPGGASGILETTDGGVTWTAHNPESTWGSGHSISFLYDPANAQGNASTWLVGTQGDGMWRTTNGGTSWSHVAPDIDIAHGAQQVCYTPAGVLYAGGYPNGVRSFNNGASWETAYPTPSWAVMSDGTKLYTGPNDVAADSVQVSTNGTSWSDLNAKVFSTGPIEMHYRSDLNVLLCSFWFDGLWAIKLGS